MSESELNSAEITIVLSFIIIILITKNVNKINLNNITSIIKDKIKIKKKKINEKMLNVNVETINFSILISIVLLVILIVIIFAKFNNKDDDIIFDNILKASSKCDLIDFKNIYKIILLFVLIILTLSLQHENYLVLLIFPIAALVFALYISNKVVCINNIPPNENDINIEKTELNKYYLYLCKFFIFIFLILGFFICYSFENRKTYYVLFLFALMILLCILFIILLYIEIFKKNYYDGFLNIFKIFLIISWVFFLISKSGLDFSFFYKERESKVSQNSNTRSIVNPNLIQSQSKLDP